MYQYMLLQALTAGPSKVCSVAPYSLLGPTVSVVTSRRYQAGFREFVSRNMAAVLHLNLVENFLKIIYGLSPSECSIRRSLGLESRGLGPGPAAALGCSSGPGASPGFSSGLTGAGSSSGAAGPGCSSEAAEPS